MVGWLHTLFLVGLLFCWAQGGTLNFTSGPLSVTIKDSATTTDVRTFSGIPNPLPSATAIRIRIMLFHTFCGDLVLRIKSPAGTTLTLSSRVGGTCENIYDNVVFEDAASFSASSITSTCSSSPKNIKPIDSLQSLFSENLNGQWSFIMTDAAGSDSGTLYGWSLELQNGCLGTNPCKNGGTCSPTSATGFTCSCTSAFTGPTCEADVDECAGANACHVNATCANTVGSYNCTCKPGFAGDGFSCGDANECAGVNNCNSQAICTNTFGSYTCTCKPGFAGDGFACDDTNECSLNTHNCHPNANCTNNFGGFSCTCSPGYFGSGVVCTDWNECIGQNGGNNCDRNALCTNTPGGFTCACKPGFYGSGINCTDWDECAGENGGHTCDPTASFCQNVPGNYTCLCKDGYSSVNDPCQEFNECLGQGLGNDCHENADCFDTVAGFSCSCKDGFTGDGVASCTDVDECSGNVCDPAASCANSIGSYSCTCNEGYFGDGDTCTDYNECLGEGAGNTCHQDAICTNAPGGYSCTCKSGYNGDGFACAEINECLTENRCDPSAVCSNTPGSFECTCLSGFFGTGATCLPLPTVSIALASHSISASWTNVPGVVSSTLHLKTPAQAVISSVSLNAGVLSHVFSGLTANTAYLVSLEPYAPDNGTTAIERSVTTYPAPIALLSASSFSSDSVTLQFEESPGASLYSVAVYDSSHALLFSRFLETSSSSAKRSAANLTAVVDGLSANTEYNLKVFAGLETVGASFSFTTTPNTPTNLRYSKDSSTSLVLLWTPPAGATRYRVTVSIGLGPVLHTHDFGAVSSGIIPDLTLGTSYVFRLYAGNAFGIDPDHFIAVSASTSTVVCPSVTEGNADWASVEAGETIFGQCLFGYGGKPQRTCNDEGGAEGTFGPISSPCIALPNPLASPPTALRFPRKVILSWTPHAGCLKAMVVNVINGISYQVEDGIDIVANTITVNTLEYFPYNFTVFCGNAGGYETIGRSIEVTTHLEAPILSLTGVNGSVWLTWIPNPMAEWYRVVYLDPQNQTHVLLNQTSEYSLNVTDLAPGILYIFAVHSGAGDSYFEPYGSVGVAYRVPGGDEENQTPPKSNLPAIIGGSVGGILAVILIFALVLGFFVYRRHRSYKEKKRNILAQNDAVSIAMTQSNVSLRRTQSTRSKATADATLLNTTMEISVPGFLLLDYSRQLRVEDNLASGGGGTVFKGMILDAEVIAQHDGIERVAIKKIAPLSTLSYDENKDRFLQEVSINWSCTFHPNIMKIIGYCLEPDFYLISKLYEIDLFTLVHHPDESIPPLLALKIASDVASAMAFIQDMGIIHRDLKSANILLETVPHESGGSILRAVVCDFGLAKVTNSAVVLTSQKFQNMAGFSPRYTAPEVFANARAMFNPDPNIEKKGDVYSFAIIIWELLVRETPWKNLGNDQIEREVRGGKRPPVPANLDSNPATQVLLELMQVCWAEQPEARPYFKQIHAKLSVLL